MSDTQYTYDLENNDGTFDQIVVTVDPVANGDTGDGQSYDVASISGFIGATDPSGTGGESIATIDGPSGAATTSPDGLYLIDNDVIITPGGGVSGLGSVDGIDNDGLLFTTADGKEYNFFSTDGSFSLLNNPGTGYADLQPVLTSTDAPCFCPGTMIMTANGEAAVETLAIGSVVLTTDGEQRVVRWIGHRAVASRFADPLTAMPIRIKAGALEDNVPVRDMLLSPCHAVLVDGVLAQAGALVNGSSIIRETVMPETFTYYHIELDDHSLILADGTPAETFIDNIDRMAFDNWEEHAAIVGEAAEIVEMAIPRAKSARQVPSAIRARLAARARGEIAAAA